MVTRNKLLAVGLLALIICHSCCIMGALGFQRAFAEAAPETYTMTNIIYINATGLGRTTPEIMRLEISETPQEIPWTKDGPIESKGIGSDLFAPNASVDVWRITDIYERQSIGNTLDILGQSVNATGAAIGIAFAFNNEIVAMNSSDFYACGFSQPALSVPAIEKVLVFKSPADYAAEYCTDNGYTLRNIINSTYLHEYDMDTLNFFQSQLVKEDLVIIRYNSTEETLSRPNLEQFGGSLVQDSKFWEIIAVGIAIAIISYFFLVPMLTNLFNDQMALEGLKLTLKDNADRFADALNTTNNLADHMLTDKNAQRQLAMNFFANGTISWEQLQYLLRQIDNSYNPLINNCTRNIVDMLNAYYNASAGNYRDYLDGIADFTSWSNWIYDIIILAVSLIAIYFVYTLIAKFRTPRAPVGSIMVIR